MFNYFSKVKSNNSGIALVLSVLILANLLIITFIVADIVLRIGRTSKQISQSEVAYYSAETAIEQAIYSIEKNFSASNLGTVASPDTYSESGYGGSYERYLEPKNNIGIICIDDNQVITYPDTVPSPSLTNISCLYPNSETRSNLTNSNPLILRLAPGKTFSFDLNITPPDSSFYPSSINISWSDSDDVKIISLYHNVTLNNYTQSESQPEATSFRLPGISVFTLNPNYRLLIKNESSSASAYFTITPADNTLPVGITITSKGYYGDEEKERIIVVDRRNWEIY